MSNVIEPCTCERPDVHRIATIFVPLVGNMAVWGCMVCGDVWVTPIPAKLETDEIPVTNVNETFGT